MKKRLVSVVLSVLTVLGLMSVSFSIELNADDNMSQQEYAVKNYNLLLDNLDDNLYGGSYINDNGKLEVLLLEGKESELKSIIKGLDGINLDVIEYGFALNSMQELNDVYDFLADNFEELPIHFLSTNVIDNVINVRMDLETELIKNKLPESVLSKSDLSESVLSKSILSEAISGLSKTKRNSNINMDLINIVNCKNELVIEAPKVNIDDMNTSLVPIEKGFSADSEAFASAVNYFDETSYIVTGNSGYGGSIEYGNTTHI